MRLALSTKRMKRQVRPGMLADRLALRISENKTAPAMAGAALDDARRQAYLSWVEILENVVLSWVPRPFTTAMMATEMPAAIRPYSIAVAPLSSRRNSKSFVIVALHERLPGRPAGTMIGAREKRFAKYDRFY